MPALQPKRPGARAGPAAYLRIICAVSAAVLCVLPAALCSAAPVASVRIHGLSALAEDKVRNLIGIEPGEEFSLTELDRSVRYLRKWGVFDEINVSPSMTDEGVALDYYIQEALAVASIELTGNYPYIENRVRKHLTLYAGDIYTPARVDEQTRRIREFYARQGFVGTEVFVDKEEVPEVNGVAITFHIRRGHVMRYGKVEVEGNSAFPDSRFYSALNTWRIFSERRLRESTEKLRKAYRDKGYPRARVRVESKKMDFDARRVDIKFRVFEGPRVLVRFEGAGHTSRSELNRAVTIFRFGSMDDFELDVSAGEIRKLMRERGYPDAEVKWERREEPDGTVIITFVIDRGLPARIRRMNFSGNRDVGSGDLSTEMKNRQMALGRRGTYYPEFTANDDASIKRAMARKGYLEAEVGGWEVSRTDQGFALDVTIPVQEGPLTVVGAVEFSGNRSFEDARLIRNLRIRPGRSLNEPGLEDDRLRLISFYKNNGHPYVEISQSFSVDDHHSATIKYEIGEGALVRIGEILMVGDVLTSQRAIMGAMALKPGDPFSERKLIESQLNIRRLGPFTYVNVETIGISDMRETVHIKVKVEEQRPFQIDLGINYSTDESITGSLTFRNINSFGWAKTNYLRLMAGVNLSRAEIGWHDPRFLSSDFEMTTAGWIQYKRQPSYAYTQVAGTLGWARRFRRTGFFVQWELNRNYFVQGDSVAADADSLRDNTISKTSLTNTFDTRDNFSFPTKGIYTISGVDLFNEIMGKSANFAKFRWKGEFNYGFWRRLVLSTSLRLDRILTMGKNVSVPTNELLFMGGDDTVRGFGYQSLGPRDAAGKATGSRARWIVNEELRLKVWKQLSAAAFFDMGSLTNDFSDTAWSSTVRKSAGLGLRYTTPVGPIRADYGFKLDRRSGESIGHFHFTFGHLF